MPSDIQARPSTADPAARAAKLAKLREAEEKKRKMRGAQLGNELCLEV